MTRSVGTGPRVEWRPTDSDQPVGQRRQKAAQVGEIGLHLLPQAVDGHVASLLDSGQTARIRPGPAEGNRFTLVGVDHVTRLLHPELDELGDVTPDLTGFPLLTGRRIGLGQALGGDGDSLQAGFDGIDSLKPG